MIDTDCSTTPIGVFGLGSMGYGMAKSALSAGFEVYGFDPNDDAVRRFQGDGGRTGSVADIVSDLSIVVIVVVNAAQTESVLFGTQGIVAQLPEGATVISCATVPPAFARDMAARCNKAGVHYLDAPISGGSKKAASGELTIMASGTTEAFDRTRTVLDALASTVFQLGDEAGAGSAMKVVNQLLAGVHIAAAAEAITFGISQGIEAQQCVEVISQCAGTSWMFENRGPHIAEGDYTPHSSVEIFVKDLGIVSDIARQSRFAAPIAATALQQFLAAAGMGYGSQDDAAVAKVYAAQAGLVLPGDEKT
jgi:3-hydroxyisobutyrate dehydrogenase-like beta-hydroxyacid dehydrogenase